MCVLAVALLFGSDVVCAAQNYDPLPLPDVPQTLREPKERAAYIVRHFWDEMDFSDTLRSCNREFMEGHFSTYASLFDHCPEKMLPGAVKELMKRAEAAPRAWATLAEVAEKYLYEPQSPVFNEHHYLLFIDRFLHSKLIEDWQKEIYRFQRRTITMNCPGKRAADFRFADEEGTMRRMHSIRSELLLVMFYDPSCSYCVKTERELGANEAIMRAVDEGRLKIVHIDVNKSDLEGRYIIEIMPTLYLLDSRKRVILKNSSVEEVGSELSR